MNGGRTTVDVANYSAHRHDGDDTVPVYMRGGTLPRSRPHSGHQRKHRNSTLGMLQQTTLSLQRPRRKPPKSFKKRARKRPTVYDHFSLAVSLACSSESSILQLRVPVTGCW